MRTRPCRPDPVARSAFAGCCFPPDGICWRSAGTCALACPTATPATPAPTISPHRRLRWPCLPGSGSGPDVPVPAEQVLRVVLLFGLDEAVEVGAVGRPDTLLVLISGLEVEVVAACREGPDALPCLPYPGHMLVVGGVSGPLTGERAHVPGVAVADRPVVVGPLVQRTREVEDDRLRQRGRHLQGTPAEGVEELIRKFGQVLGLPVVVVPLGLHAVEHRLLVGVGLLGDEVGDRGTEGADRGEAGLHFGAAVAHEQPDDGPAVPLLR